jgi:hypothetical protein
VGRLVEPLKYSQEFHSYALAEGIRYLVVSLAIRIQVDSMTRMEIDGGSIMNAKTENAGMSGPGGNCAIG